MESSGKIGYFSATAAKRHGYSIYTTPDGGSVEVTCVGERAWCEENYRWKDKVEVGPVVKWVGRFKGQDDFHYIDQSFYHSFPVQKLNNSHNSNGI